MLWVITAALCWCKQCIIVWTAKLKVVATHPPQMVWVSPLTSVLSNWAVLTPDINVCFNKIYLIICSFYIVVNCVKKGDGYCGYMVFTQMVYACPLAIIWCVPICCDSTEFTLWWRWWPGNEIKTRLLFSSLIVFTHLYIAAISSAKAIRSWLNEGASSWRTCWFRSNWWGHMMLW